MNKAELVSAVADKSGQSAAAVGSVLAAFEEVVTSTVAPAAPSNMPSTTTPTIGQSSPGTLGTSDCGAAASSTTPAAS